MLPKPVSTTPTAAAAAGDRPQLKIAARATQDAADVQPTASVVIPTASVVIPAAAVVINDELSGFHGQWRRTLETVKATLADLEQACESAIDAREAEVARLTDTLVESAAAEAATAAEQTREQARIEIGALQRALAELQTRVETLQSDLDAERESVKSINVQLETELAARGRAETERDEARAECQRQAAAARSQVEALRSESSARSAELSVARQELAAAIAERSKLMATFQTVQRALAQGTSVDIAAQTENGGGDASALAESRKLHPENGSARDGSRPAASVLAEAQVALINAHPEAVEDVTRVLEQVEAIYHLDLNSGRSGMELVNSLTDSLRYARDVILARWKSEDCDAETLFANQVAVLLDVNAATSFGRHLSIAAYASHEPAAASNETESGTDVS